MVRFQLIFYIIPIMEYCPYLYNLKYNDFDDVCFEIVYVSLHQHVINHIYFFNILAQLLLIETH